MSIQQPGNLFLPVKTIATLTGRVMVFFSTGKDSVCTLDLISKYLEKEKYDIVHFYYYKNLSIREKVLQFYERKIGKQIIRLPHPERAWFFKRMGVKDVKTRVVINDTEAYLKKQYKCQYVAYGHRLAENLTRRAMLKHVKDGVDRKTERVYPVLFFKKAHVLGYIEKNRLLLPIDYEYGWHDINVFKGEPLLWLYNNFREDYGRIKREFPFIEEDLKKAQWEISVY